MQTPVPLAAPTRRVRSSDIRDLLRHAQLPGMISLAGGLPAADLFDIAGVQAAAECVFGQNPKAALQYGTTEGQPRLQAALAELMAARGCSVDPGQIVVTTGSQQAIDLVARSLLEEGTAVVLERPAYVAAIQTFQLAGAKLLTLDCDADGARIDELDAGCGNPKPRLIYLVTNFANPSGATLSLERRERLLRWAVANQVFVLEDDPYGELRTRGKPLPPLLALAARIPGAADYCGYASSLSKILAPGLRIGWMVLPRWLQQPAVTIKQALDLHTSSLNQEIAATYLESGRLPARLPLLREVYAARNQALCDALQSRFGNLLSFNRPEGGMFVWCRFETDIDTRELLPLARNEGMIYVPGDAFFTDAPDRRSLRLSFVTASEAQLTEGVDRLARAVDLYTAGRRQAA